MADKNKSLDQHDDKDEVLDVDPLTGSRTVAQTPTSDEDIHPLPSTTDEDGNETRAGDFDTTTGAAHPAENK